MFTVGIDVDTRLFSGVLSQVPLAGLVWGQLFMYFRANSVLSL
jgi:hypothetical protein